MYFYIYYSKDLQLAIRRGSWGQYGGLQMTETQTAEMWNVSG